ncbi:MAG: triphosphoribosyl-dephospho-CoA synthase [Candidatus Nezhaarchaeales archaeon]
MYASSGSDGALARKSAAVKYGVASWLIVMRMLRTAEDVMVAAQLAATLEVSGWPKPGNVHRTSSYPDKGFEHFLAGSIALGPAIKLAAVRGVKARLKDDFSRVQLGALIKKACKASLSWQRAGNTHLGVVLLFTPIAVAIGSLLPWEGGVQRLRDNAIRVMRSTTPIDTLRVYEAIRLMKPSGLGRVKGEGFDVFSERSEVLRRGITLFDSMKVAAKWDSVAKELADGFTVTFTVGYPYFMKLYEETYDVNVAVVHTYLKLLSTYPDTFIARNVGLKITEDAEEAVKLGLEEARKVSMKADEVLRLGGLQTAEGRKMLLKLDEELKSLGQDYNPGATADLTASSIFVAVLEGFRP